MKTLKFIVIGLLFVVSNAMHAQVSIQVNIGNPPSWGPAGYSNVDFYYLPDIEAYYDIRAGQFIYFNFGQWTRSRYLPRQYRNYNLYSGYKVILNDYHGTRPFINFNNHRVKYYRGYHGNAQRNIGSYRNESARENRMDNRNESRNEGRNEGRNDDKNRQNKEGENTNRGNKERGNRND